MTRLAPSVLLLAALTAGTPSLTAAQEAAPAVCRWEERRLADMLYPVGDRSFSGVDTAVDRGPAAEYAKGRPWFDRYERITFRGATYIPFGVARPFVTVPIQSAPDERIIRAAVHDGEVPVYIPLKFIDAKVPGVLHLLAERGCVFQAYHELSTVRINHGPGKVVGDPLPAYLAVLEHVRAAEGARSRRAIVLDEKLMRWPGADASTSPPLPDAVRDALMRTGALAGSCPRGAAQSCAIAAPALLLHLGEVAEPPDTLYVKIPPTESPTFDIQQSRIDAMPDSARVRADL